MFDAVGGLANVSGASHSSPHHYGFSQSMVLVKARGFAPMECDLTTDTSPNDWKSDILLDNGLTVIRHTYRPGTDKKILVVTFSEMRLNDPSEPGFGEWFLTSRGLDGVYVQKRSENWYQDLDIGSFTMAVKPVRDQYRRTVCYGISMGAYASLMYGGNINADILAISPLVSIHPDFPELGGEEFRGKIQFNHIRMSEAATGSGTYYILYDPTLFSDKIYVSKEVMPFFSTENIQTVPYAGHPALQSLIQMGLSQKVVGDFIEHGVVTNVRALMRERRLLSSRYLENLADACASRRRPCLALRLYESALFDMERKLEIEQKIANLRMASACL
jgi:hypothetical protein